MTLPAPTFPGTEPSQASGDVGAQLIGSWIRDRYRIDELVASGGMGWVFRAHEAPFNRPVALKIAQPAEGSSQATQLERFKLEAATLAELAHPHIVTIYDYGSMQGGLLFLAMEFVEGRSVAELIAEEGPLPTERVIAISAQACRGIRKAHRIGLLHRDIKPANIMVQSDGGDDYVKLVDFGVAKFFESEWARGGDPAWLDLTMTGSLIGSPAYMAPEQVVGDELDPRTDIYSIGATMYHMLAGVAPFKGESSYEVIRKQVGVSPTAFSELESPVAVPASLEAVVLRCLEKSPEDRYQSVDELLSALKDVHHSLTLEDSYDASLLSIYFESEVVEPLPISQKLLSTQYVRRPTSSPALPNPSRSFSDALARPLEWTWRHWLLIFLLGTLWGSIAGVGIDASTDAEPGEVVASSPTEVPTPAAVAPVVTEVIVVAPVSPPASEAATPRASTKEIHASVSPRRGAKKRGRTRKKKRSRTRVRKRRPPKPEEYKDNPF